MFNQLTLRYRQALCLFFLAAVILFLQTPATAQSIPTTLGWYQIPNTKLRSVCPPNGYGGSGYSFNSLCPNVTLAWSGGTFDATRNRLLMVGGGHGDYKGNEIYALNLNNLTIQRLTNPGLPLSTSCTSAIANGSQPNSRHTYDGVGYIANGDRLWIGGGSLACGSGVSATNGDMWTFHFGSGTWENRNNATEVGGTLGNLCVTSCYNWSAEYDPSKQLLFFRDIFYLYTFNHATNTVTRVSNRLDASLYTSAVIDTDKHLFVEIGNGIVQAFDISGSAPHPGVKRTTTGATTIVSSKSPGLAYDPVQKKVVAWDGANTVYLLDTTTWKWTSVSHSGGPAKVGSQGTFGRFAYSPQSNVFVTCNSVDANCYTLRLTSGGSTTPPSFDFALSNGGNQSITQGQSGAENITATLVSGSAQTVGFSVSGVPSGALTAFTAGSCMTTCSTSLNITTTTSTTAGSYPITVTAAGGGVTRTSNFNLTVNAVSTPPPPGSSADADFQTRCSAGGVVKCWGFDNPATDLVLNTHIFAGTSTTPSQDTSIKTSGAGALRFTLPPPSHGGANMAGKWEPQGTGLGATFGAGSSFYVQFRMRVSSGMLTNTWNSSWKFFELLYKNSTCGNTGLIFVNKDMKRVVSGYSECGNRQIGVAGPGGALGPGGPVPPYSIQQFDDGRKCDYREWSTSNHPDCLYFKADTWMTFTFKVDVGGLNQSNGRIQAWYSDGTTPVKRFLDTGFAYPIIGPSTGTVLNTANFSTYMTSLSSSSGLAGVTSHMWIDEFIISTQPIAQPGAATSSPTPPAAPSNLVLK